MRAPETAGMGERFGVERRLARGWFGPKVVDQAVARKQYAAMVTAELDRARKFRRPVRMVHGYVDNGGQWYGEPTSLESYDPADHDLKRPGRRKAGRR